MEAKSLCGWWLYLKNNCSVQWRVSLRALTTKMSALKLSFWLQQHMFAGPWGGDFRLTKVGLILHIKHFMKSCVFITSLHLSIRKRLEVTPAGDHWVCAGIRARHLLLEGSLQHLQDGFTHFILEILAHKYIQKWVQAAVEESQACCYGDSDSRDVV